MSWHTKLCSYDIAQRFRPSRLDLGYLALLVEDTRVNIHEPRVFIENLKVMVHTRLGV